jgi:hypothetical protein
MGSIEVAAVDTEVHTFEVDVPEADIDELRRRINEVGRGNHFAAWQEPELFVGELRAAFKSLRRAS